MYRLIAITLFAVILTFCGEIKLAADEGIPNLPASYYGSVKKIDGQAVSSGRVEAYIEGIKRGELDFTNGYYGAEFGGLKLPVQGPDEINGKTVTFKVVIGSQIYDALPDQPVIMEFEDIRQVNLTVDMNSALPNPPVVSGTDPLPGAADIPVDKTISIIFNGKIQEGSNYSGITLSAGQNGVTVFKSINNNTLILNPALNLAGNTNHFVTIPAGAVKDVNGSINPTYTFYFTTGSSPDQSTSYKADTVKLVVEGTYIPGYFNGITVEIPASQFSAGAYELGMRLPVGFYADVAATFEGFTSGAPNQVQNIVVNPHGTADPENPLGYNEYVFSVTLGEPGVDHIGNFHIDFFNFKVPSGASGDVNLLFEATSDPPFLSAAINFASVGNGIVTVSIGSIDRITSKPPSPDTSDNLIGDIRIIEDRPGALKQVSNTLKIKLPDGYTWWNIGDLQQIWGDTLTPIITIMDSGRTLNLATAATTIEFAGFWAISDLKIVADPNVATPGDVMCSIGGYSDTAPASLTVAKYQQKPAIQTFDFTDLTKDSITLQGNITDTGGEDCDIRKFQYRIIGAINWTDAGVMEGLFGTGKFLYHLKGLNPATNYEFKAMAHNSAGWGEGDAMSFTTQAAPTGTGISGTFTWQVAPQSADIPQAEIALWTEGADRTTAIPVLTQMVDVTASDNNGTFQLTGLQPGNYDVTFKLPCSLRALKSSVTVTRDAMTDVDFDEIILGDTWGEEGPDNVIDVSDYSAILYSFGSVPGDGKYIDTCDLNRDGVVDVSDYSIVLYNFGKCGTAPF
jgi:hypothetical protein